MSHLISEQLVIAKYNLRGAQAAEKFLEERIQSNPNDSLAKGVLAETTKLVAKYQSAYDMLLA